MGILKDCLLENERNFREDKYVDCTLKKDDPLGWEVVFTRLQGIVQNAKEIAMNITSSPVVREMGECVFALYTPEGDSVCFSTGIILHVTAMGGAIKFMINNDYEEKVGFKDGDHFFNNDPYIGGAHSPDQSIITPIILEGKLIGWACGLTHVPETGASEAGGTPTTASSRYEEGIYLPCVKVAEHDQPKRDLEIMVERGTRTPVWWLMDARAKTAGTTLIREAIKDIVAEMGVDKYRKLVNEYIEDTRQASLKKIQKVFFPGIYRTRVFYDVANKNRPMLHREDYEENITLSMKVNSKGEIFLDFDGTSPPGKHSYNASLPTTIGNLNLAFILSTFYDIKYNQGINQAIMHPSRSNIPVSTINPVDISYACSNWGPGAGGSVWTAATECISRAYYARGIREEITGHRNTGAGGLRWAGVDQYGRPSAGQNFEQGSSGMPASAVIDGLDTCYATYNPEGDMSDAEVWERVFPFVWLGRSIQMDGGGFGRFRGGSGILSVYLVKHVESIQVGSSKSKHYVFNSPGLMGAYPVSCTRRYSFHINNLQESMKNEVALPHLGYKKDIKVDIRQGLDSKTNPVHPVYADDVVVIEQGGAGGFGDPLDRDPKTVLKDVQLNITSNIVAENVYGVIVSPDYRQVDENATVAKRREIRLIRAKQAIPASEYIARQRELILSGNIPEVPKKSLNQCLSSSEKFRKEFLDCWGLPKDFRSIQ